MRATGAELMAFHEAWPFTNDWYQDDECHQYYDDKGRLVLEPTIKYDVFDVLGTLCYQGKGVAQCTVAGRLIDVECGNPMVKAFKAWRDSQDRFVVVQVPPSDEAGFVELQALATRRGWKLK